MFDMSDVKNDLRAERQLDAMREAAQASGDAAQGIAALLAASTAAELLATQRAESAEARADQAEERRRSPCCGGRESAPSRQSPPQSSP